MHPDLLSFVKLPAANSASEELQQTAARKLQQNDGPFQEGEGAFYSSPTSSASTADSFTELCHAA
jgi:hypothetical protein